MTSSNIPWTGNVFESYFKNHYFPQFFMGIYLAVENVSFWIIWKHEKIKGTNYLSYHLIYLANVQQSLTYNLRLMRGKVGGLWKLLDNLCWSRYSFPSYNSQNFYWWNLRDGRRRQTSSLIYSFAPGFSILEGRYFLSIQDKYFLITRYCIVKSSWISIF